MVKLFAILMYEYIGLDEVTLPERLPQSHKAPYWSNNDLS